MFDRMPQYDVDDVSQHVMYFVMLPQCCVGVRAVVTPITYDS